MMNKTMLQSRLLNEAKGLRHGFFTRQGGVSQGIYASLNCGYGSDDNPDAVNENRRRAALHLSCAHTDIVTAYQIHSAQVLVVDALFQPDAVPQGDALVSKTPGLAIGVLTADCTPVLFADPEARIVGAAHAGWRGAASGILEATLEAMEAIGGKRCRIRAAIGPAIHQPNYEVGAEFKAEFLNANPENERFFNQPAQAAKPRFDLPDFCNARLEAAGVNWIDNIDLCTYADESLFFSYRRKIHRLEPDYGRQISAIVAT
ncbi:MAG: peptidoglycan editing factor PgeF [Pseudomonadota bacterium]